MLLSEPIETNNQRIKTKKFGGGNYITMSVPFMSAGQAWEKLVQWVSTHNIYSFAEYQWFEEHRLSHAKLNDKRMAKLYMPIQNKNN